MDGGNSNKDARVSTPGKEHFEVLRQAICDQSQARRSRYWEDRVVTPAPHDGFLAVSWTGSHKYAMAHAFKRAWAKEEAAFKDAKHRTGRAVTKAYRKKRHDETVKQVRQSYEHKQPGQYPHEAYIFRKESEIAPDILKQFGLDLSDGFGALPLHHYFRISRRMPVADRGEASVFTRWKLEPKTYASSQALTDALLDEIFVDECPDVMGPPPPPPWWVTLIKIALPVIALLAVLSLLGWWLLNTEMPMLNRSLESRLGMVETEVAGLQSQLSGIDAQYAELQQRLDELIDASATRDEVQALRTQLDAIDIRRADQVHAAMGQDGGQVVLGRPACLAIKTSDGRSVPDYLFAATVSAEGIRIDPHAGNGLPENAAIREQALARLVDAEGRSITARNFSDTPLSIAEFHAFAQQLLEAAPDCAHYVVLREDLRGPADRYAELRHAVESRFYIYRPLGR